MRKIKITRPQKDEKVEYHTRPTQRPPRFDLRKQRLLEEKDLDHPDRDPDLKKD